MFAQVKYLMFVTVADEEFHQAVKIFNANSVSKGSLLYLIALPKFSSAGAVLNILSLSLYLPLEVMMRRLTKQCACLISIGM